MALLAGSSFIIYRNVFMLRFVIPAIIIAFASYRIYERRLHLTENARMGITLRTWSDFKHRVTYELPPLSENIFTNKNGLNIGWQRIGNGPELIVLANGIGGTIFTFESLLHAMHARGNLNDFTIISWNYRGLWNSDFPEHISRLSIRDHAEDARELIYAAGFQSAHTMIGWSTGVQVTLEFSLLYPDLVGRLVLMNGAYGNTLHVCCQPLVQLPLLGEFVQIFVHYFLLITTHYYENVLKIVVSLQRPTIPLWQAYGWFWGNPSAQFIGSQYVADIFCNGLAHLESYIRCFTFLDIHSVKPLLGEIRHHTHIVTGLLDTLTPSVLSFEMHYKIKNSQIDCYTFGTHFVLLEFRRSVATNIVNFIYSSAVADQRRRPFLDEHQRVSYSLRKFQYATE